MPINLSEEQQHIRDFLESQRVAVLATCSKDGIPHAAAIYFHFDGSEFFFITKTETAKHKNLQENALAALAISDPESQTTVQVQGRTMVEKDLAQGQKAFAEALKGAMQTSESGIPPITKLKAGDYVVYKLSPTAMRMASYVRPDPGTYEDIFEIYR